MSEDERAPIPLNMNVMRTVAGPEFDEDSAAIEAWLRGAAEPAFAEIGKRLISIHEELHRRGWYEPDEFVQAAVAAVRECVSGENASELRGAVARLVEITRGILHTRPPQPTGPGGPKAAQMSLGRKKS